MNNKLNDLIVISQKDIVGSIKLLYNLKAYFNPNIDYTIVVLGYENENLINLVSNIAKEYYKSNMLDNIEVVEVSHYDDLNYNFKFYAGIPGMKNVKYNRKSNKKRILNKDALYTEYYMINTLKEFINHYSITRVYFPYIQYDLKCMSIEDILNSENRYRNENFNNISEYIFPYISTKMWSTLDITNCKTVINNSCRWDTGIGTKFIKEIKDNYTLYEYILFDTREPLASLTSLIERLQYAPNKKTAKKIRVIPYDADKNKFKEISELVLSFKDYYRYNDMELMDIDTKDKSIYDILSNLELKNRYIIILPYTSDHGYSYVKDSYFGHNETRLESIYNIIIPNRDMISELFTIDTNMNKLCLIELLKKYKYSDNSIIKSIKDPICELAPVVDSENLPDKVKKHVKDLYYICNEDEKEDTNEKLHCRVEDKFINRLDEEFNKIKNSDDTIVSKEDYKRLINSLKDEDVAKPAKVSVHIENNDKQTEDNTLQNISSQIDKMKEEILLKLYERIYKELIKEESDK